MDVSWARCGYARALREGLLSGVLGPLSDLYLRRSTKDRSIFDGRLSPPVIFVANHSSHLDTPTILRAMPRKWRNRTAVAAAAYRLLRRGRILAAAFGLAIYSGSGLVGIGHYTVPGATGMPWWRQAHIEADISCGVALLACALWLTRRARAPIRGQPAR